MEKFDFDISLKNIPIPTKKVFMRQMINKTENFVSRIRWATDVFTFPDKYKHNQIAPYKEGIEVDVVKITF